MINFIIDFGIYSKRAASPQKREVRALAWYRALLAPLQSLNASFFGVYWPDVLARSKRTGQKIILEDTLNRVFNFGGSPLIYIDNSGDDIPQTFMYNENEGYPPLYMYNEAEGNPTFLYNEAEGFGGPGFVVYVPGHILSNYTENQIREEVKKYTPSSRVFDISIY